MSIVKRTPLAKEDLIDIWVFIAIESDSPTNADRFIDKLDKTFFKLAKHPEIGKDRSHRSPGIRSWPLGNYLIFYRPIIDGIEVIRVINSKRDLDQQSIK